MTFPKKTQTKLPEGGEVGILAPGLNKARSKTHFASCYSDISYLIRLKDISRMLKNWVWVSAGPRHTVHKKANCGKFYLTLKIIPVELIIGLQMINILLGIHFINLSVI